MTAPRRVGLVALLALGGVAMPAETQAQIEVRDLVLTMGASGERYTGKDFPIITAPFVDTTDHATTAVGEIGLRAQLRLVHGDDYDVDLFFDGGLRQAAAMGFTKRDPSPREWVSSSLLRLNQGLGSFGSFRIDAGLSTRAVSDRPPMPLFLQPGYTTASGALTVFTRSIDGVTLDFGTVAERADYRATDLVPQLDLLDRQAVGLEAGALWGAGASYIRFYGGVRWSEYEHQGSFDASDPFRRDRTVRAGIGWTYQGHVLVQAGVEGALNRSNGNRPEYDALSASAILTAPLPAEFTLNAYVLLTGKSYVHETGFARLVPGEEADNASIAYLEAVRAVRRNLDAGLRLGWTRAETDYADAYYQRFGVSFRLTYRPMGN